MWDGRSQCSQAFLRVSRAGACACGPFAETRRTLVTPLRAAASRLQQGSDVQHAEHRKADRDRELRKRGRRRFHKSDIQTIRTLKYEITVRSVRERFQNSPRQLVCMRELARSCGLMVAPPTQRFRQVELGQVELGQVELGRQLLPHSFPRGDMDGTKQWLP